MSKEKACSLGYTEAGQILFSKALELWSKEPDTSSLARHLHAAGKWAIETSLPEELKKYAENVEMPHIDEYLRGVEANIEEKLKIHVD